MCVCVRFVSFGIYANYYYEWCSRICIKIWICARDHPTLVIWFCFVSNGIEYILMMVCKIFFTLKFNCSREGFVGSQVRLSVSVLVSRLMQIGHDTQPVNMNEWMNAFYIQMLAVQETEERPARIHSQNTPQANPKFDSIGICVCVLWEICARVCLGISHFCVTKTQ